MHSLETYEMKDGKMYYLKAGKESLMSKEVTLKNGTVIMTNGVYKMKNGKEVKLTNGESLDENGKMGKEMHSPKKSK